MAKILCPKCCTVSSVPDTYLGRKVRCKVCNEPFVAAGGGAAVETTAQAVTATTPAVPAAKATATKSPAAVNVTARRVGGTRGPGARTAWLLAAFVAFVGPVAAAGVFVALNWGRAETEEKRDDNPTAAELHGGIEIGASGVKATVVELIPSPDLGVDYRIVFKPKEINPKLVVGMTARGEFAAGALSDTVDVVKTYFDQMVKKSGLAPEKIHIVAGSGLFKELRGRKDLTDEEKQTAIEKNQKALIQAVKKETGRTLDFIDARQEVRLLITGLVPAKHTKDALLIDVGSGGTRGGYRDPSSPFVMFESKGIGEYENLVKKGKDKAESFVAAAERLTEKEVSEPLRSDHLERKRGLLNRKRIYLNGGISWVLATFQHPDDRKGNYVRLSARDIEDFAALLRRDPQQFPSLKLPESMDVEVRKQVEKDLAKMQDIFSPERLIAGTEVLRALSREMKFQDKELFFTRDGQIGWLLAYIGEKNAGL